MNDHDPNTANVTIYPDQLMTRRLRKHIVIGKEPPIEQYHTQIVELLEALYDQGIHEAVLQGASRAFLITWAALPD